MIYPYQPEQCQRFNDAFALGASPLACSTTPDILAQNESFLAPPLGWGAFKWLPVSRLYFSLPLAVSPAPFFVGNFSPRPTAKDGPPFLKGTVLLPLLAPTPEPELGAEL